MVLMMDKLLDVVLLEHLWGKQLVEKLDDVMDASLEKEYKLSIQYSIADLLDIH